MSIEFWLRFEPQIRATRLAISLILITTRAERKARSCVKLFDFFRGWILLRLNWNLSRYVPNSVEILTWNFRKKLFRENFSRKPRLYTTETCEIWPYILQFLFCVHTALKIFTQVLWYFVCTQVRRHVHTWITKRRYGEEKARRFFFRKTSFVHYRSGTYYALLLGCFGLKSLPEVRHCVYWVLAEISATDSSHKILNKLIIDHYQGCKEGSFVRETVWFFSWVNTHPFDLKIVACCSKFSGVSYVKF